MQSLDDQKIRRDLRVLSDLTEIYCREKHKNREKTPIVPKGTLMNYADVLRVSLCSDCRKLVLHGASKRVRCPMDPKPECKHCPEHCYQPKYREQVRQVMRFAWRHLLLRGRFDLILKHL